MRTKELMLILCVSFLLGMVAASDDAEATTYGSPDVGAHKVVFDANGGTGGYTQYVLNGVETYLPTERVPTGESAIHYAKVSRSGYALIGWSTDPSASSPMYYPGDSITITRDIDLYAVWVDLTYKAGLLRGSDLGQSFEAEHKVVSKNGSVVLDTSSWFDSLVLETLSSAGLTFTLSVTHDGITKSSVLEYRSGTISADWVTLIVSNGSMSISGVPNDVGTYVITLNYRTGWSNNVLEDLNYKWVVSTYDVTRDSSNLCSISYTGENRYDTEYDFVCYAPYNTAIRLPDASIFKNIDSGDVDSRIYPYGWNITVKGAKATFPLGGAYTLDSPDKAMTLELYDYERVIEAGFIGVLAYNSNGGSYNGSIAQIVGEGRIVQLKGVSSIEKDGYTLIGWNMTGDPGDPIYPFGYQYRIVDTDDYIELKAVWIKEGSAHAVAVSFVHPGDVSQNTDYAVYRGFDYCFPKYNITYGTSSDEYVFRGWNGNEYGIGEGEPIGSDTFNVSATTTYYAVFSKAEYTYTIRYDGNGGYGHMEDSVIVSEVRPYTIELTDCTFLRDGFNFIGWAESPTAGSPSYTDVYTFGNGSQTVTLYAVWSDAPSVDGDGRLMGLAFYGNGSGVSGMPSSVMSIHKQTSRYAEFTVPNIVPQRDGYQFLGWSVEPQVVHGAHVFMPGDTVVFRFDGSKWTICDGITVLDKGQIAQSVVLQLYAVWTSPTGVDGTVCTITFKDGPTVLRSVEVYKGKTVNEIAVSIPDGYAKRGWITSGMTYWDFRSVVMEDMTLNLQKFPVFSLSVDGSEVRVTLDDSIVSSKTTVRFSDGHYATFVKSYVYDVGSDRSGTAVVTIVTGSGTITSKCSYNTDTDSPDIPGTGGSDGDDSDRPLLGGMLGDAPSNMIATFVLIVAGIIALLRITRRI